METAILAEQLKNIRETLSRIEAQLATLNGRMAKVEQWQAATDPVIDTMNERIDETTDASSKNTEYINLQKGWNSGRAQMIIQVGTLIGIGATLLKLILSKA